MKPKLEHDPMALHLAGSLLTFLLWLAFFFAAWIILP